MITDYDRHRLADLLHSEMCGDIYKDKCPRYTNGSGHHTYYYERASYIITNLEPEIGLSNVFTAVRIIIGTCQPV